MSSATSPEADLSVAALVKEAVAQAGWSGGDIPFTTNLELLLRSCRRTGALNATGIQVLRKAALRHLRNLCYLQAYVDAHPEVAEQRLDAPVVVTGLPRTGTTLAHNLLALDPDYRVLRFWESLHPLPHGAFGLSAAELQTQADRWLASFYRLVPEFQAIHRATATGPEECDALLQNAFASQHFDDMFDADDYSEWLAGAPLTREYEHYALQLRVLSTSSPEGARWALKSPSHLGHLDALLAALPGCTVLVCHRHPREAVASYASLMYTLRRAYCETVSPAVVGQQALGRAATATLRALDLRDTIHGSRFVDVAYRDLVHDPVTVVGTAYQRLGRPLGRALEERMRQWTLRNPQHAHGFHRYDLARFGLTEAEVDSEFASYMERFGPMVGS